MSIRIVISLLVVTFVASPLYAQNRSQQGAVAGGIAGAILGGIAGHQNDETPEGIAIGGAVGAIAGGLLGRSQDDQMVRDYQIQQQRAFQNQQRIQAAVSVQDVITLAQTGVSDSLIINQMRNNGVRQKIGVNEIITLHRNGVSELVINEMQKLGTSTGSTVSVAATRRSNEYRRAGCDSTDSSNL